MEDLYYYHAGRPVAVRVIDGAQDDLYFLLTDHLGSVNVVAERPDDVVTPTLVSKLRYLPWGETWEAMTDTVPIDQTDFHFTGQREEADIGLYDYKARRLALAPSIPRNWSGFALTTNCGRMITYFGQWRANPCLRCYSHPESESSCLPASFAIPKSGSMPVACPERLVSTIMPCGGNWTTWNVWGF
jgi:hypothetical protein